MIAYKQEKAAEAVLSGASGLEHYIAKHYVVRSYHGKKQRKLVPSIPNVVFVHAVREEIVEFKKRHNFIKFAMEHTSSGKSYLRVPDGQMQDFIRVSSAYGSDIRYYNPEELDAANGTRVRIHGGLFDGVRGTLVKVKGKRNKQVVVIIPQVVAVSVEVHPDLVEVE